LRSARRFAGAAVRPIGNLAPPLSARARSRQKQIVAHRSHRIPPLWPLSTDFSTGFLSTPRRSCKRSPAAHACQGILMFTPWKRGPKAHMLGGTSEVEMQLVVVPEPLTDPKVFGAFEGAFVRALPPLFFAFAGEIASNQIRRATAVQFT
jgi:hypothetical protein